MRRRDDAADVADGSKRRRVEEEAPPPPPAAPPPPPAAPPPPPAAPPAALVAPGGAAAAGDAPMEAEVFPNTTAPNSLLTYADWGKHLRADYKHDKLRPEPPYNIGGTAAVEDLGGGRTREFCETAFFEYAQNVDVVRTNAEFKSRMKAVVEFKVPRNTDEFKPLPTLDVLENGQIGIVMDAGTNITDELGAKNIITFGMILDPASSPVSRKRRPIYCEPDERHFYIDLEGFGFDKNVIRGIWIADVIGGEEVKTAWVVGPAFPPSGADYRLYDPMRRGFVEAGLTEANFTNFDSIRPHLDRLVPKVINKVGGDYSGRESAESLPEMIGKTLGDTMIVASAMPTVAGVRNPFYNPNSIVGWKKLERGNPDAGRSPSLYVVKTGDILNAVRAIFKGVRVILEDHIEGIDYKQYRYYPAQVDEGAVLASLPASYGVMIAQATERYDALIEAFRGAVDRPDADTAELKSGIGSILEETGGRVIRTIATEAQRRTVGQLFRSIRAQLEQLKDLVVRYFRRRRAEVDADVAARVPDDSLSLPERPTKIRKVVTTGRPPTFKQIMDNYTADLEHLKNLCPQTDKIWQSEKPKGILPIIPITRTNGTIDLGTGPVPDMEIRLLTAFQAIVRGAPNYDGTLYKQRFEDRLAALVGGGGAGGADGGAAAAGMPFDDELGPYIRSIVEGPPDGDGGAGGPAPDEYGGLGAIEGGRRGGANGAAGGAPVDPGFRFLADANSGISAETFPLITQFIDYWQETAGSIEDVELLFTTLFYLIRMRESPRIASPFLLEQMESEFHHLKGTGAVSYEYDVIPADVEQTMSTISTLVYNAFTMAVNRANTMMYEGDEDIGFGYLENKFREIIESRVQVAAASARESGTATPLGATLPSGSAPPVDFSQLSVITTSPPRTRGAPGGSPAKRSPFSWRKIDPITGEPIGLRSVETPARGSRMTDSDIATAGGNRRTPRRKNRKSTYRLQKKPTK